MGLSALRALPVPLVPLDLSELLDRMGQQGKMELQERLDCLVLQALPDPLDPLELPERMVRMGLVDPLDYRDRRGPKAFRARSVLLVPQGSRGFKARPVLLVHLV